MAPASSAQDFSSPVLDLFPLNDAYFMFAVKHPHLAQSASPGQFAMLRLPDAQDPLLRRPFSVWDTDGEQRVEFFAKIVGKGTKRLRALTPASDNIDVLGPLGKPFCLNFEKPIKRVVLVGGGTGIGGLFFAARHLKETAARPVHLFYGGRTRSEVHPEDFARLGVDVKITTDDGSMGKRGLVSEALEPFLAHYASETTALVCGPLPMMRAVSSMCRKLGVSHQISMESFMACGIGVCLSCVTTTKGGYKRVCTEGPVFQDKELLW